MQPLTADTTSEVGPEDAAACELERVFRKADFRAMRVHGQFNLGFIMASVGRDVFVVDQHAADEKFNFERLRACTTLNKCVAATHRCAAMCVAEPLLLAAVLPVLRVVCRTPLSVARTKCSRRWHMQAAADCATGPGAVSGR